MSLFRKAQSAVAHNSMIPSLGNNDLKLLQDLIHAEKSFVASNAKTANELKYTCDALRAWGSNEGDDLEDILPKVALLFEHLSRAENRYNYYVSTMRLHLKSIRSREEKFAEFKARRRALVTKIDGMERKLARMGPENKDLAKVTSSLRELRSDMDVLNNEIAHEYATLGDYKRRAIVEALHLKSSGLMELAEKAIVIAESTRRLADEVPLTPTNPNEERAPYRNEARTNRVLSEAVRQLDHIRFEPHDAPLAVDPTEPSPSSPMPTHPRYDMPEANETAAVVDTNGQRVAVIQDTERGSQGWVAPPEADISAETTFPQATWSRPPTMGLATVPESIDGVDEVQEAEGVRAPEQVIMPPEPSYYGYHEPPPADERDTSGMQRMLTDSGLNHVSDAIPSFPPMPAPHPPPPAGPTSSVYTYDRMPTHAAPQADAYAAYPQVPNAYVAESTYQAPLTNGASMQPMPAMSPHDAESYSQPTPSATYAPVARSEPMVTQPQSATGAAPSLSPSVYQAPFAQAAYQAPPPSYLQQNAPTGYVLPPPSHTGASVIAPPSPRYPSM